MGNRNQFQSFAKPSNKAIIYTRVASQLQNDNSKILYQKQQCQLKAQHLQLEVIEYFCGICKSGLETWLDIEQMIRYAKTHHISTIIVYTYDRLSRKNIFSTIQNIKNLGIDIIPVILPKKNNSNISKIYRA